MFAIRSCNIMLSKNYALGNHINILFMNLEYIFASNEYLYFPVFRIPFDWDWEFVFYFLSAAYFMLIIYSTLHFLFLWTFVEIKKKKPTVYCLWYINQLFGNFLDQGWWALLTFIIFYIEVLSIGCFLTSFIFLIV